MCGCAGLGKMQGLQEKKKKEKKRKEKERLRKNKLLSHLTCNRYELLVIRRVPDPFFDQKLGQHRYVKPNKHLLCSCYATISKVLTVRSHSPRTTKGRSPHKLTNISPSNRFGIIRDLPVVCSSGNRLSPSAHSRNKTNIRSHCHRHWRRSQSTELAVKLSGDRVCGAGVAIAQKPSFHYGWLETSSPFPSGAVARHTDGNGAVDNHHRLLNPAADKISLWCFPEAGVIYLVEICPLPVVGSGLTDAIRLALHKCFRHLFPPRGCGDFDREPSGGVVHV